MKFALNNPAEWCHVMGGEKICFAANAQRKVQFAVNTTAPVVVWVSPNEDMSDRVLVAASRGMFECSFSGSGDQYVEFDTNHGAIIYVRSACRKQVIPAGDGEKYTNVVPQGRRNSDLDRMMHMVALNDKKRERQMQFEIQRLRAAAEAAEAVVTEPEPQPEPQPEPKAEPKSETKDENDA